MNLESNAAKTIAALAVLNIGLFFSHHVPVKAIYTPTVQASVVSQRAEMCKVRTEARLAAMEARLQARAAAREMVRARRQVKQATVMAPNATPTKCNMSVTDYVRGIVSSGMRTLASGI
ncbi:hypothetical protein Acid345_0582 [Candidatus Koribacter versatilis Ellin345]|uniref:Uncharacterized protein n=1 Tax=Koribacter versatilis (strain Ellin345) TaxID=204669 RepID=Q1IU63_KORVE|nr:hypothetical protein [Candidatus Koribacter versatilis]ABF39587.1 hypothetical protein Acid345_0582 [Candidatus Koribacter versatilis Ellin345]